MVLAMVVVVLAAHRRDDHSAAVDILDNFAPLDIDMASAVDDSQRVVVDNCLAADHNSLAAAVDFGHTYFVPVHSVAADKRQLVGLEALELVTMPQPEVRPMAAKFVKLELDFAFDS